MSSANPFWNEEPISGSKSNLSIYGLPIALLSLLTIVIGYLVLFAPIQVDGFSMYPKLDNDQVLIANKIPQLATSPALRKFLNVEYKRGDIVAFKKDGLPDLVKRIIALPGDQISIKSGLIYINGQLSTETYYSGVTEAGDFLPETVTITLDPDTFFVMGDNRSASIDSRSNSIGAVSRSQIIGKILFRVSPLKQFGPIN